MKPTNEEAFVQLLDLFGAMCMRGGKAPDDERVRALSLSARAATIEMFVSALREKRDPDAPYAQTYLALKLDSMDAINKVSELFDDEELASTDEDLN